MREGTRAPETGKRTICQGRGGRRESGHAGKEGGREERRKEPTSGTCRRNREEKAQEKIVRRARDGMQENDVSLGYRLQMVAISRAGASEVASEIEERVMERLRDIAATAGMLFSQKVMSGGWWRR